MFVRVLAEVVGRFAEDRILTEVQGEFRSGRRCLDQWLVLRDVCQVWKRKKKNSYLVPSWILVRHMTVCGERD